jgi:tetratricopeptide (TPR) repeat protein
MARPDDPEAYRSFGDAMFAKRRYAEAAAALREVVRLKPDEGESWNRLGSALSNLGQVAEAADAHRKAAKLSPDQPAVLYNLAACLLRIGEDEEALSVFRRLSERWKGVLGSSVLKDPMAEAERRVALLPRLPAVIRGEDRPRDDAERLALARMCMARQFHAAAARLFAESIQAAAKADQHEPAPYLFEAASAAALAGAGRGKDNPPPDAAAKTKLRSQALDWLKAEREARARSLDEGGPEARSSIAQIFQQWKASTVLAVCRDPEALSKLPQEERQAWQAFWREVDDLLKRAQR